VGDQPLSRGIKYAGSADSVGYTPVASKKAAGDCGGTTAFWEYYKAGMQFFLCLASVRQVSARVFRGFCRVSVFTRAQLTSTFGGRNSMKYRNSSSHTHISGITLNVMVFCSRDDWLADRRSTEWRFSPLPAGGQWKRALLISGSRSHRRMRTQSITLSQCERVCRN